LCASEWPSLEVWECSDGNAPQLLFFFNDASARNVLNTGWRDFRIEFPQMKYRRLAVAAARAAAVALLAVIAVLVVTQGVARPLKWELPFGFEGWVRAQYADPSCAPPSAEGIFDVLVIDRDGFVCTSSSLRHGWYWVAYESVEDGKGTAIDGSRISAGSVDWNRQREMFFAGARNLADPARLPSDWR
jgi:hypothetical protein